MPRGEQCCSSSAKRLWVPRSQKTLMTRTWTARKQRYGGRCWMILSKMMLRLGLPHQQHAHHFRRTPSRPISRAGGHRNIRAERCVGGQNSIVHQTPEWWRRRRGPANLLPQPLLRPPLVPPLPPAPNWSHCLLVNESSWPFLEKLWWRRHHRRTNCETRGSP